MQELIKVIPRQVWRLVTALNVVVLLAVIVATFLVTPLFRSDALLIPKSAFSSSPAELAGGAQAALLGLGLGGAGSKLAAFEPILKSAAVVDRFIETSGLRKAVAKETIEDYRELVSNIVQIDFRKDGTIVISVEDKTPAVAQQYGLAYVAAFEEVSKEIAERSARTQFEAMASIIEHAKSSYRSANETVSKARIDESVVRSDPTTLAQALTELENKVLVSKVQLAQLESTMTASNPTMIAARAAHQQLLAARDRLLNSVPKASDEAASAASGFALEMALSRQAAGIVGAYTQAREKVLIDSMLASSPYAVAQSSTLPERRSWPQRRKMVLFGLMTQALVTIALLGVFASMRLRREGAGVDV